MISILPRFADGLHLDRERSVFEPILHKPVQSTGSFIAHAVWAHQVRPVDVKDLTPTCLRHCSVAPTAGGPCTALALEDCGYVFGVHDKILPRTPNTYTHFRSLTNPLLEGPQREFLDALKLTLFREVDQRFFRDVFVVDHVFQCTRAFRLQRTQVYQL